MTAKMAITNQSQLKQYNIEQETADAIRTADLIDQMQSVKGRRIMWGMLKSLGYQDAVTDTNAAVYGKVAKQAVANKMVMQLKAKCRDLFYTMEIENDGLGG